MNKIFAVLSLGLVCFCAYSYAMEEAVEQVVQEIVEPVLDTIESSHTQEVVCKVCALKNRYNALCALCKQHAYAIVIGVVAVATVIVCTIPAIKNEIKNVLSSQDKKQSTPMVSEAHSLPQEKIYDVIVA